MIIGQYVRLKTGSLAISAQKKTVNFPKDRYSRVSVNESRTRPLDYDAKTSRLERNLFITSLET